MIYLNSTYNGNNKKQQELIDAKDKEKYYYACCCQTPDKPHDECSKFKFITMEDIKEDMKLSEEDYKKFKQRELEQMDKPIFPNYPEGPFNWLKGDYSMKDHLLQRIQDYKLFSRSNEIQ